MNCSRPNQKRSAKHAYHTGGRHRLLHMRAFLAGNRGQSRFHEIFDGPSFNSRVRHQEGKTSRPQIWEKPGDKEYYLANQLKKKCKNNKFQGIHDRFLLDHTFFERMKTIEMKKFVDDGMLLQMKITLIICQNQNTSTTRTNGGFIPRSQVLTLSLRHRPDFKQALSCGE